MAGKKEEEEEEEKEIYYSITAEMIIARPSSCSSQHTLSPISGTARFAYVPRELPQDRPRKGPHYAT